MTMTCPKCGHQRTAADDPTIPDAQCPACGIYYFKFLNQKSSEPTSGTQFKTSNQAKKEENQRNKELEKQQKKEKKERNRPVLTANFMVSGCNHENRQTTIRRYVIEEDKAILQRDKNNRFSHYAVKVLTKSGQQVGFVPEIQAKNIAEVLEDNLKYDAIFTKIVGHDFDIPVVDVKFYRTDADLGQLPQIPQIPPESPKPELTEAQKLVAYQELATHKTNHLLHLFITLFTVGFWLLPWFIMSASNTGERNKIRKRYNLPIESDTAGNMIKIALILFVIVVFIRGCVIH